MPPMRLQILDGSNEATDCVLILLDGPNEATNCILILLDSSNEATTASSIFFFSRLATLHASSTCVIRQIAMVPHGNVLFAASDDGMHAWDIVDVKEAVEANL